MKLVLEASDVEELQQRFPSASKKKIREANRRALISYYQTLWEEIEEELENDYCDSED
jgi:hypothetical protein